MESNFIHDIIDKDIAEHKYSSICDPDCDICGATRSVVHTFDPNWKTDGEYHWHECTVCGTKVDNYVHTYNSDKCTEPCRVCGYVRGHEYDNACDDTCNICNEHRTPQHSYAEVWSKDGAQHWHECSVCHDKTDAANHVYDNACDTDCNICGATRTITHDYAEV